jgi:hypothetical protein
MKDKQVLLFLFYFVLIAGGSWYYGDYSKRELTSFESQGAFKESVLKAQKGMNEKQKREYLEFAGAAELKDF